MSVEKLVILGRRKRMCAALLGKAKGFDVFVSELGVLPEATRIIFEREQIEFEEGAIPYLV